MEGKIEACQWCRETQRPMLGICLGLQAAVIEFSRNVLGLKGANSTEVDPLCEDKLVIDMPEHHPGNMGGTMRLGKRKTYLEPSVISEYHFFFRQIKLTNLYIVKGRSNQSVLDSVHSGGDQFFIMNL